MSVKPVFVDASGSGTFTSRAMDSLSAGRGLPKPNLQRVFGAGSGFDSNVLKTQDSAAFLALCNGKVTLLTMFPKTSQKVMQGGSRLRPSLARKKAKTEANM